MSVKIISLCSASYVSWQCDTGRIFCYSRTAAEHWPTGRVFYKYMREKNLWDLEWDAYQLILFMLAYKYSVSIHTMFTGCLMALKLNSIGLFVFIMADRYIRILLMSNCTILLTYCGLHAVEYSMLIETWVSDSRVSCAAVDWKLWLKNASGKSWNFL